MIGSLQASDIITAYTESDTTRMDARDICINIISHTIVTESGPRVFIGKLHKIEVHTISDHSDKRDDQQQLHHAGAVTSISESHIIKSEKRRSGTIEIDKI
jgi:hypothetical protein